MPQNKKKDLPACPFYFGDWKKCPEVRALDLETRMIWFEMLGFMWESTERGYLTINSKPIDTPTLARMIGIHTNKMKTSLKKMGVFEIFSLRSDGAIYCRRMVKDEEKRQLFIESGRKGGNPALGRDKGKVNPGVKGGGYPSPENETENEKGREEKKNFTLPPNHPNAVQDLIDDEVEKRKHWQVQPEDL